MSEKSQWYYVENQERKGPVTISAIKKLVGQGVVNEQTLVWKEGMQDWEPARAIKGLFERKPEALPKVNVAGSPKSKSPRPTATPVAIDPGADPNEPPGSSNSGSAPSGNSPKPTPVSVTPQPTITPNDLAQEASTDFSIQASEPAASRSRLGAGGHFIEKVQFLGYPCLLAGFLLVIGSKGCDSLGNRWASRLNANSQIAEANFSYRYDRKRNTLQAQIDAQNASDNPNADRIRDLNKQITDLSREQSKERLRLTKTTWFELKAAARTARANNQAWGFYRELGFVFGSMVLSVGLLVLGITGNVSEKWTCLIMLAIITFSIYIGGFAWFSSIAGSIPGGMGL